MPDLELWKLFFSLGVPGAALGIFFGLFKVFHWDFPRVPRGWVGPLVVLFMLTTTIVVLYALTVFARPIEDKRARLTNEDQAVLEAKQKIMDVRGDFEALGKYPHRRREVSDNAKREAEIILGISDKGLDPSYQIVKYQYATYALVISAATASSNGSQRTLAERARSVGDKALAFYKELQSRSLERDVAAQAAYKWLLDDDGLNRTLYLLAWAQAIVAHYSGETQSKDVLSTLSRIDWSYVARIPPKADPELAWALETAAVDQVPCGITSS